VVVIDDGSTDKTLKIAKKHGASCIHIKKNRGYDSALIVGLKFAFKKKYDYAITMDADGQHSIKDFLKIKNKLETGKDICAGKRLKFQRWSEKIFSYFTEKKWGIHDPLCGLKGYKIKKIKKIMPTNKDLYIGTRLLLKGADDQSMQIEQIFVQSKSRKGSSRFGSGLKSNFKILYALAKVFKNIL